MWKLLGSLIICVPIIFLSSPANQNDPSPFVIGDHAGANYRFTPASMAFAHRVIHSGRQLPESVFASLQAPDVEPEVTGSFSPTTSLAGSPLRAYTRSELCSSAAVVAEANDLPIPFFANLIWQESSFDIRVISRAGAQGIAQFMPGTAIEFGLMNPFDPIHALSAAGQFLRQLNERYNNLGLAAAAYNAGPGRVNRWMKKRTSLPRETRNYVRRITGLAAEDWAHSKLRAEEVMMPAKAPCPQVAEALEHQAKARRIVGLLSEIAGAIPPARLQVDASLEHGPGALDQPKASMALAAHGDNGNATPARQRSNSKSRMRLAYRW